MGSFNENGILIEGQKVKYQIEGCNKYGLPKLKFSEPVEPKVFYHYMPGKKDAFGDQPHVIDEVAAEYVEIRKIDDYKVIFLSYSFNPSDTNVYFDACVPRGSQI